MKFSSAPSHSSKPPTGGTSYLGALSLAFFASVAVGCNRPEVSGPAQKRAPEAEKAPRLEARAANASATPNSETNPPPQPPSPPPQEEAVPERHAYRVAALGDSITDYRVGGGGYLRLLERLCPESRFENFGKGGDMTNQMRRRFESDILPRAAAGEFDTLLFYGGVNDLYSDETAFRTNEKIKEDMLRVFRAAKGVGLRVIALTVSPWGGFTKYFNERRGENTRLINSFLLGLPRESPPLVDVVVDTYPLLSCGVPTHLCAEYQLHHRDGIHPGPVGHQRIFELTQEKAFSDCR